MRFLRKGIATQGTAEVVQALSQALARAFADLAESSGCGANFFHMELKFRARELFQVDIPPVTIPRLCVHRELPDFKILLA